MGQACFNGNRETPIAVGAFVGLRWSHSDHVTGVCFDATHVLIRSMRLRMSLSRGTWVSIGVTVLVGGLTLWLSGYPRAGMIMTLIGIVITVIALLILEKHKQNGKNESVSQVITQTANPSFTANPTINVNLTSQTHPAIPPLAPTQKQSERRPNIDDHGYVYRKVIKTDGVWMVHPEGASLNGLLFDFSNDPDEDGNGVDAKALRAQLIFTYPDEIPGPRFSPLYWIGERHGSIDMQLGKGKQLLIGIKAGSGWVGFANQESTTQSDELPFRSCRMTLQIIGDMSGSSVVLYKKYFDWKIDLGTNHPTFSLATPPIK